MGPPGRYFAPESARRRKGAEAVRPLNATPTWSRTMRPSERHPSEKADKEEGGNDSNEPEQTSKARRTGKPQGSAILRTWIQRAVTGVILAGADLHRRYTYGHN